MRIGRLQFTWDRASTWLPLLYRPRRFRTLNMIWVGKLLIRWDSRA